MIIEGSQLSMTVNANIQTSKHLIKSAVPVTKATELTGNMPLVIINLVLFILMKIALNRFPVSRIPSTQNRLLIDL